MHSFPDLCSCLVTSNAWRSFGEIFCCLAVPGFQPWLFKDSLREPLTSLFLPNRFFVG